MTFAIFAASDPVLLGNAIAAMYPDDSIQVADGQWLIVDDGTSQSVSAKLGITAQPNVGLAIVVAIAGYYGRQPINVWEWLTVKWR